MSNDYDNLSPEKQHYVSTLSNKKRLYQANTQLQSAVTAALTMKDNPQALKLAQDISAASQTVQSIANNLHQQQKAIEEKHPELKAQAVEYSQNRQHKNAQQVHEEPKQRQQHHPQPQQGF
ncbi:hypothetical protein [Agarilytica rhodophyticola]|uniref:hypothetical protein n=1 Tax=Agarilytica rhodophyticola TaxID=1737490 RepID=UPI000B346825|nr:hypothetical protein [Agarilytica rhodophyticola]